MRKFLLPAMLLLVLSSTFSVSSYAQNSKSESSVTDYADESRFQDYINLANSMRDFVTPSEYAEVYLPIKIKAAKAKASIKVNGPLSQTTHKAILTLVAFVINNESRLTKLWEIEKLFNTAVDLNEMTMALSRDLE